MKRFLPKQIEVLVAGRAYEQNGVGMSDSEVFVFDDRVLKIQARSEETDNEVEVIRWLDGRLPAPEILAYAVEGGTAYTLMTRMSGRMVCDEVYMNAPETAVPLLAEALRRLWTVDTASCPQKVSRLDARLRAARYNVEHGLVDTDNVEADTFGPNGFRDPEELLRWLEQNRPEEDLVFTHGDFCLPNLFAEGKRLTGYIDLGKAGLADRWQDAAICLRSLRHNAEGYYTDGKPFFSVDRDAFFDLLGIPFDEQKNRYYLLLDELF